MPPRRKPGRRPHDVPPDLCYYKPRNAACVYLNGGRKLLGEWGSPEAKAAYKAVVASWEATNRGRQFRPSGVVTVADLVASFISHAEVYYRRADGSRTDEVAHYRVALRPLLAIGDRPVDFVTFKDIVEIRDAWVRADHERQYVNKLLFRVKHVFAWGRRERLVPAAIAADVSDVPSLPKGRSTARERQPIRSADLRDVRAAMRHLAPEFRLAVLIQLRCCARPGEVCAMHSREIHRGSVVVDGEHLAVPPGVLAFAPSQHKAGWRGKTVIYTIGPKLQKRLAPLLARGGFLFPGVRAEHWVENWYSRKIKKACEAAGVAWTPNQLRHTALTRLKRLAGREAARAAVDHGSARTTDTYLDRDLTDKGKISLRWG